MSDFWVFGYGSLMWRPGFAHRERVPALLPGAHRSLCVYSWVHRGTRERPGLVLGLDQGGSCHGVAYRVEGGSRDDVLRYLRERELITFVYREVWRTVRLIGMGNRTVSALAYVVDRRSPQYAGRLPRETLLAHVRRATGRSGDNASYVVNTARHLNDLGISDPTLTWLAAALGRGKR
ncbi:MAG: gamma-glutamylcyclotransferase [Bauldia sp.]